MSITAYRLSHLYGTTCVVVGLGLIGRATAAFLSLFGAEVNPGSNKIVDWNSSDSITSTIRLFMGKERGPLELIWCAGPSGFFATDSELAVEYRVFDEVIEQLLKTYKKLAVSHMSSAGGLYEGSGGTQGSSDQVCPVRPYGIWKLKQEQLLHDRVAVSRIYRIATVYGVSSAKSRQGIVNALIESTYTNKPAIIYAQSSTLRDYVSNLDVGSHVVSQLRSNASSVELIASGRPTSIDMLANLMKRVSHRNLKISYQPNAENAKDIVFSKKSVAQDFKSRSLEEGILNLASTYRAIKFS